MLINDSKIFFLLFSILPASIVIGPSISLLNISFIIFLYFFSFIRKKHYEFLYKDNTLRLLFAIYIYLIINTFISLNYEIGLYRNIGFIRLIFLFIAINYFFFISQTNLKIFNIWIIFFVIFVTDVYFERFSGANFFGWGAVEINNVPQPNGTRVVSFFKDEPIVGAYLNAFIFLIFGYLLTIFRDKKKILLLLTLIFFYFLIAILLTGERSNSIKVIFGTILFLSVIDLLKTRFKIFVFFILISTIILTISNSDYLKNRYYGQLFKKAFIEKDTNFFENNTYIKLYKSGYEVFKNSPLLGVGNKNYRVETCSEKSIKYDYYCTTHPHQIYLEFLSEHGLIGTIILLSIFFILIFKNLKIMILSQNYIQIGAFFYLLSTFLPLIPSGSFFTDFNITLFFINFSLMYSVSKNTNIFSQKKIYSN